MVQCCIFSTTDFGFDSSENRIVGHIVTAYIYIVKNKQQIIRKKIAQFVYNGFNFKNLFFREKNDLKCQIIIHVDDSLFYVPLRFSQIFDSIATTSSCDLPRSFWNWNDKNKEEVKKKNHVDTDSLFA